MVIYTVNYLFYTSISDTEYGRADKRQIKFKSDSTIEDDIICNFLNKKLMDHYKNRFGKIEIEEIYYEDVCSIPTFKEIFHLNLDEWYQESE